MGDHNERCASGRPPAESESAALRAELADLKKRHENVQANCATARAELASTLTDLAAADANARNLERERDEARKLVRWDVADQKYSDLHSKIADALPLADWAPGAMLIQDAVRNVVAERDAAAAASNRGVENGVVALRALAAALSEGSTRDMEEAVTSAEARYEERLSQTLDEDRENRDLAAALSEGGKLSFDPVR